MPASVPEPIALRALVNHRDYLVWFDAPARSSNPKFGYALACYSDGFFELTSEGGLELPASQIKKVWELPSPRGD